MDVREVRDPSKKQESRIVGLRGRTAQTLRKTLSDEEKSYVIGEGPPRQKDFVGEEEKKGARMVSQNTRQWMICQHYAMA